MTHEPARLTPAYPDRPRYESATSGYGLVKPSAPFAQWVVAEHTMARMTFVLRLSEDPNGVDLDLGPTIELFSAFAEMGRLHAGEGYEQLYGVPLTNEEAISSEYRQMIGEQARRFLDDHGSRASEHTLWVLNQIANLPISPNPDSRPPCPSCGGTESWIEERDGIPGAPPISFGTWVICMACQSQWPNY